MKTSGLRSTLGRCTGSGRLALSAPTVDAQSAGCTDQALALAEGQLTDTLAYTSTSQFPVSTSPANGNNGIWPLSYWTTRLLPRRTLDNVRKNAQQAPGSTRAKPRPPHAIARREAPDHDIGFKDSRHLRKFLSHRPYPADMDCHPDCRQCHGYQSLARLPHASGQVSSNPGPITTATSP